MFRNNISTMVIVIIAAAIPAYYFYVINDMRSYSTGPFPLSWEINQPQDDTAFGGLFYNPAMEDSLPQYQYRRIEDSIKHITDSISVNNKTNGNSIGFSAISMLEMTDYTSNPWHEYKKDAIFNGLQDSMNMLSNKTIGLKEADARAGRDKMIGDIGWRMNVRMKELDREKTLQQKKKYFLGLNNYDIKEPNTRFFVKNGTYNLAYVVWDSVSKRTHDSTMKGHYGQKMIRVRYSAEDKRIYIPLTKQQYLFTRFALSTVTYGSLFLMTYFFIGVPLLILISIANGNAFTLKNIRRFRSMALVLLIYALVDLASPYIFKLLYHDIIPEELMLTPFGYTFIPQLPSFLTAVGLFLISKAFQSGFTLQQENALTV